MSKRKCEFTDYSKVQEEAVSASIHGIVTCLSPLKKSHGGAGNGYYDGEVCDGTQSLRFVGFSPMQQKHLDDFLTTKKAIRFDDCQIKKSIRDSSKLDIKGSTRITASENDFSVSQSHS